MRFQIIQNNLALGGFAPAWYNETYPSYGNKNNAGDMTNIDMTNAGYICQGPGLATLTDGDQDGAVTTLIKGAEDRSITSDTTYGVGGNQLYQISSTAVANAGIWPHTIDKAAVTGELGEDVAYYQGKIYYSYNHSSSAGDIGQYDLATTFDDDWGSTSPSGATALGDNPHPMVVGGADDILYIADGQYVASYDGTNYVSQAIDLPANNVITSLAWSSDRLWMAANSPDLTGSNKNSASIFIWDGTTNQFESEIRVMGRVGGLHVKNGVVFVFFQDITSTGGYKLGYVNGSGITELANFTGSLPEFHQISDYKDFIIWNSSGEIWAYGSGDRDLPARLFQIADGGHATGGALFCPFGTPMTASWDDSTNYKLAKFSGYDVNSDWKGMTFDITANQLVSSLNFMVITFEALATGARVDWSIKNNKGTTLINDNISFGKLGAATSIRVPLNDLVTENFRLELDYSNGDTTNTVKIKTIKIYGTN